MVIPYQVYRHFKGNMYLVLSVAVSEATLEPEVVYMSLNGDSKVWTRNLHEFESLVPEGRDNPTGQLHRFELIKDLRSVLSHCTTKSLVEELKSRPDSPFNENDIEGLNDKVADREFILGEIRPSLTDPKAGGYLHSIYSSDSLEEVKGFAERHFDHLNSRTRIYKSVLVEVQSFD